MQQLYQTKKTAQGKSCISHSIAARSLFTDGGGDKAYNYAHIITKL